MSWLELHFARPGLLAALVLPLLVFWLARRPRRPAEAATGTLAIWREVADGSQPPGARRQRRPPWLLLAALTLGALALAGPRAARAAPPVWRILVDRSPSMHLPHEQGGTRLERALAAAAAELERLGANERRWLAFDGETFVAAGGDAPPAAWRRPPPVPHPEPDWARLDRPRTLWVSDAAPAPRPQSAGLVLSGGAAVPGPAALGADGALLAFDGQRLVPTGERAGPRAVSVGGALPEPVRALAELWAAERGLGWNRAAGARAALSIEGPAEGAAAAAAERLRIGRDGWELDVPAGPGLALPSPGPDFEPALRSWLEARGEVRVAAAPGKVRLSFAQADRPGGDPAAFALGWSALFDACLLPPPGLVPVAERLAAGEPLVQSPRAGSGTAEARPAGPPLAALLSGAAALLVLLTFVPRRNPARRGSVRLL